MNAAVRPPAFLHGGHEMGARIRAFEWASHPLGPPEGWPDALKMGISLCLNSSFPTAIYWGADFHVLYNDAWSVIPAERHPAALGQPARELWADIWPVVGPQFERVRDTGEGLALFEQMLPMVRDGHPRESWWNYSLSALRNPDNSVGGIFNQGHEITEKVLARRDRQAEVDRWRELFMQAPAAVALLRGPEHRYEFANDAYLKLVMREVLGRTVSEALPEIVEQGFVAVLDGVFRTGEPYIAASTEVSFRPSTGGAIESRVLDFIFRPVRSRAGEIEGIFILATDVTERSKAESELKISNWKLGEERARLAAIVEAEQRAQAALRRFNDTLEGHVRMRTAELTRTIDKQVAIGDRLRATFETSLTYQGYLNLDGTLLDANMTSLRGISAPLHEVVGKPFWETPWFSATPGAAEVVRAGVLAAREGKASRQALTVNLPEGRRTFDFSLRPVFDSRRNVIGIVPEAVDITPRT